MNLATLLQRINAFLDEDLVDITTEQLTDALERRGGFVESILDSKVEEYAEVPRWSRCSTDVRVYYRGIAHEEERDCQTRSACRAVDEDLRRLRKVVRRDLRIQRLFTQMSPATPRELLLLAISGAMHPRFSMPCEGFSAENQLDQAWIKARRRFDAEVTIPVAELTL